MLVFTEKSNGPGGKEVESNKYYEAKVLQSSGGWITLCRWGRIGAAKGQTQQKMFRTEWEAKSYADNKLYEKRSKGYREIDDNDFKVMVATAQLVGLRNKIVSNRWLERVNGKWIDVNESRLQEPSCFPGLEVVFNEAGGERHKFLFTSEGTFVAPANNILERVNTWDFTKISPTHPMAAVADAVHTAIFSV